MWGGRFSGPPSEALWRFTVDHSDRRLLSDDITGSLAHVAMLGEVGILEPEDVDAITTGLEEIRRRPRRDDSNSSTPTRTCTRRSSVASMS